MTVSNDTAISLRLQRLIEANQALAQVESLQELLPKLLQFAQEVTNAEASSILMYKPDTETLEFTLAYNEQEGAAESIINQNIELKLGEGIAGHVAKTRKSVIVADAKEDTRFCGNVDRASGFETRSILCAPVVSQEELLGVVQVLNAKDKSQFDSQDLLILESFSHLAAVALVRSRLLEAKLKQERMQAQLDAAAKIQENFLPSLPEIDRNHEVFAVTQPAIFVGGDFYDLITLPDQSLLVCVADVSGKGLPAALIGVTLWTNIRSLALQTVSPAALLLRLNEAVYDVMRQQMFATLVCCRYWPAEGRALAALAGHLPPIVVHDATYKEIAELKGRPVGILPENEISEKEVFLEVGDSLMFITDGVTEARNAAGDFYGEKRLAEQLTTSHGPRGKNLLAAVEKWRGGSDANDDLTVVEIWRK